jgi:protein-tyrosine phosphatase
LLCRTRKELDVQAKRLLAVQVISVAGFLLVPLRYSFARPHTSGLFGAMFAALSDFDRPFNQAPSLHLGLTTVIWAKYRDHRQGVPLWLVRVWFFLMGASTLTTYQHHFIDVPTGIWVGLLALVLVPEAPPKQSFQPSRDLRRFRLSARYLILTLLQLFLAYRLGGAAWLLLWPAGATVIVAGIYLRGRGELFQKVDGRMPRTVVALLGPYLVAAWLNSRWWTRNEKGAVEIAPGVFVGRAARRAERAAQGVASMVDVAAELPVDTEGVVYRCVPMLDLLVPTVEQLEAGVQAVAELKDHRPTLVCCALGYSRSAAVVVAWLVASGKAASVKEAIGLARARQPRLVLGSADVKRLEEWARRRGAA